MATVERPLLSKLAKEKRIERCQKMEDWFVSNEGRRGSKRVVLWSDEKLFVVDQVVNRRNRRVVIKNANVNKQAAMKTKHPSSVMVFGLIASNGRVMPPFFVESGVRINAKYYQENILPAVESWCATEYGVNWRRKVVLMQDGAPCHTARSVQSYLAENWGSEAFWPKDLWPPSSPDLNPIDF